MPVQPFVGSIFMTSFNFAPKGWALCNGQLLPINQNQPLFSILGTMYGGDGRTTFALPNLQGRVPLHFGAGFTLGQVGGELNHTLIMSELPAHTHLPQGSTQTANQVSALNNFWGAQPANPYSSAGPDGTLSVAAIGIAGGSQPHPNTQPYLVVNFIIALQGIFPSRN